MNSENNLQEKSNRQLTQFQTNQNLTNLNLYQSSIGLKICTICFEAQQSLLFFSCLDHSFCKRCINHIIQNSIRQFTIAKCPLQICSINFTENSPYFSMMPMELKTKYIKTLKNKLLITNPQLRICSKIQCEGTIENTNSKLECNKCKQLYCDKCLEIKHNGKCDQLIARGLQKKYRFRRCPSCKMVVQKAEGCDHMTCICIHQFCYKCGKSYKQNHKCQMPQNLGYFAAYRWSIEFEQQNIHLNQILYYLEPDPQKHYLFQKIYLTIFALLIYPWLSSIAITIIISTMFAYFTFCLTVIILYFIFIPLLEVLNMQLMPAKFLQIKNMPTILIRFLMIPLFPLNLFFGLYEKWKMFSCSGEKPRIIAAFKMMKFFITLPILLSTDLQ